MSNQPLFRSEALNARRNKWLGEILLIRPFGYKALTLLAAVIAAVIVLFLIFGSYTKRTTVSGELVPDSGLAKIYSAQRGVIVERRVQEGQPVKRGQVLFVVSSERYASEVGSIEAEIARQAGKRRDIMVEEQAQTARQQEQERATLSTRITGLEAELAKLATLIDGQQARVALAEQAFKRYSGLYEKEYVARDEVDRREQDWLDQRARLQSFERERIGLERERASAVAELASMRFRQQATLSQYDRNLAGLSQEITESEGKRAVEIVAPEDGIATAVVGTVGAITDGSRPLVAIVPARSRLVAQLYAPSRAVGFVKPGDRAMLRFQAYPYQKFGHHRGKVVAVSRTALPPGEISNFAAGNQQAQQGEPLYRITVELPGQSVTAYGKQQRLQAGMLLDADVMQDRRRLYEWVLEPLYSLTGKL